ncbi:MAG TPA: hypothetical protein VGL22_06985 [Terracidiphilus sp.]|jgi:hypothetical protein
MKRITLSADAEQIDTARAIARAQGRTLNDAFREWLVELTSTSPMASEEGQSVDYDALMKTLRHTHPEQPRHRSQK